jgi:3',5'-cyclic AMP phosphodiesterase CpdA
MLHRHVIPWLFLLVLPISGCGGCGADDSSQDIPPVLDTGLMDDVAALDPWRQPDVWVEPADAMPGERVTVFYQGHLADRAELTLHYAFDGGYDIDGVEGWLGELDESTCPDFYLELELEPAVDGGFTGELELPLGAAVLDLWFEDPSDGSQDDAGGLRYHHTQAFPHAGPWLTWSADARPSEGVVVNWQTDMPCRGVVAYATEGGTTSLAAGGRRRFRHHVALAELEPGTRYQYRVFDCAGHASEAFWFTTLPVDASALELVVLADIQDDGDPDEAWGAVAQAVLDEAGGSDLLLIPGDMPCSDHPGSWWRLFHSGRALFAGTPVVPVLGNHDTPGKGHNQDSSSFASLFTLPDGSGTEAYYRLDLGLLSILALNSETPALLVRDAGAQRAWLEAELDDLRGQGGWVFVALHEPIYNLGRRFYLGQDEYRPVSEGFDGVVDWVFTGHEHIYQRMHPLRFDAELAPSGRYGRGEDDGVGYLVVPTAGDATFEGAILSPMAPTADERDWLAYPVPDDDADWIPTEIGFTRVSIEGERFELTVWGMGTLADPLDPHVVDVLSYERR